MDVSKTIQYFPEKKKIILLNIFIPGSKQAILIKFPSIRLLLLKMLFVSVMIMSKE